MYNVLVVDDEAIIATQLENILLSMSYKYAGWAVTAEEAIKKVEKLKPDLVLMDIVMPGEKDGIDAAVEINEKMGIPVIFLTAHANDKYLERAKKAKPHGYLIKPFGKDDVKATVQMVMNRIEMEKGI